MWLPLARPLLGTWPATQACVLTGNRTSDPLVCRPALSPLGHISQGEHKEFFILASTDSEIPHVVLFEKDLKF